MAVDRRTLQLGGAAVVVLLVAAWTLWPSTPTAVTTPAPARDRARPAAAADAATQGPVGGVKLKELAAVREEPGDRTRNPFRFQPKPAPPPPPRPVVAAPVVEAPRPAVPTGPPPAPPIPLKLIGVLERANGVKWAVLTDGKSPSPMYGKDGDIIDGRYTIVKIGTESIEMTYVDGRGRQVIRLTGQ
jgi:hypothetical protein